MTTERRKVQLCRRLLAAMLFLAVVSGWCWAGEPIGEMIEVVLEGQKIEGTPIAWDSEQVYLLGRDGRLWDFKPNAAADFRVVASQFRGYSPSEFRAVLLRELGQGYEATGTGHYIVAHPGAQRDKWAQRFEDLYRSFVHYFSVRGFSLSQPPFLLVGVVCRDRADFVRHSAVHGNVAPNGVLGYYSVESNRINLYDMGIAADSPNWAQNASVLIHEATHQTAFNTGVHSRYCLPPTWVVEGLATMFEAPGVYDSQNHPRLADRVNQNQLKAFRSAVAPRHRPELIVNLTTSDKLFEVNPGAAYAESWALTFFLAETMPRQYMAYLKRTASYPPFHDYSPSERLADFTAVFGDDWPMLEARMLRFIRDIKSE